MKTILKKLLLILIPVGIIFTGFYSCDSEDLEDIKKIFNALDDVLGEDGDMESLFGWMETDEDMDGIETDISLGSNENLPASVDLKQYFPPIGNQRSYGTCVAWAVGYNLKSFLDAKDNDYSPTSTSQQYSPKDLFWAISNDDKGADCNGSNFEPALDIIISRGIAPLSVVPYSSLGDCSQRPDASWTNEAGNYKISNYRKVASSNNVDVNTLKGYLANGRAVVIGAKLGDDFMQWDSDDVIDSDTYNNPGMQHAYHAMILSGYDDSKEAFRVVNSWATSWGNNGYIWVDYDFFSSDFCFAAFVATNIKSNPDEDDDNEVDDVVSGYDLVAWNLEDEAYEDVRLITYNVYNSGENTITKEQDWNILYVYYNAYDAEEYGILVFDYYTDDFGDNERHYDPIPDGHELALGQTNWWNYIDIPSGKSVADALIPGIENFEFTYELPNITGYYYLVLIADGFDVIAEYDETNNYYFFTDANGDPISIVNGIIQGGLKNGRIVNEKPEQYAASPSPTAVNKGNVNTYSPEEIMKMLKYHKETGQLQEKTSQFLKNRKIQSTKKIVR
ncbi:MAG: hypothetical protein KAT68_10750 [Bacteroidales bacterium]|nr:hypothetical protein [Bacteroidales bacterium]